MTHKREVRSLLNLCCGCITSQSFITSNIYLCNKWWFINGFGNLKFMTNLLPNLMKTYIYIWILICYITIIIINHSWKTLCIPDCLKYLRFQNTISKKRRSICMLLFEKEKKKKKKSKINWWRIGVVSRQKRRLFNLVNMSTTQLFQNRRSHCVYCQVKRKRPEPRAKSQEGSTESSQSLTSLTPVPSNSISRNGPFRDHLLLR